MHTLASDRTPYIPSPRRSPYVPRQRPHPIHTLAKAQPIVGCVYVPPSSLHDANYYYACPRCSPAAAAAAFGLYCGVHVYRGIPAAVHSAPLALRPTSSESQAYCDIRLQRATPGGAQTGVPSCWPSRLVVLLAFAAVACMAAQVRVYPRSRRTKGWSGRRLVLPRQPPCRTHLYVRSTLHSHTAQHSTPIHATQKHTLGILGCAFEVGRSWSTSRGPLEADVRNELSPVRLATA